MTDEERQKFCDALRTTHPSRTMCKDAANEIERLAARVASLEQSCEMHIAIIHGLESECSNYLNDFSEMQESRNRWRAKADPTGRYNYDDEPDEPRDSAPARPD
jgi:hypothetical protein